MTDIKTVWQNQKSEEKDMIALSEIRDATRQFRTRARLRNIALYIYSAFNIVVGLWLALSPDFAEFKYPMLLMVAAHLFVLWQINARIAARPLPEEMAARTALDHHRTELERQHNALQGAWLWYIAPFMPALIWEIAIRAMMETPSIPPRADRMIVLYLILASAFFWTSVWLLFSRAALKVQLQIERLKLLKAE
jgi:hypothetical protein